LFFFVVLALEDYRRALEFDEDNRRAKEGTQRVQKMQKQAGKRDYYKILGVKRTANKQEIVKAYRKAAQKWHPDNYPDGDDKKVAEKKFIDIAAAKEVLTDPEKRAKFDQGEDPLDPEQQNGGSHGFNPFAHFHQFNQGPFHFKFHT
jgi:DnaJ family protein C protein 3